MGLLHVEYRDAGSFRHRIASSAPEYLVEVSTNLIDWEGNLEGQPHVMVLVGAPVENCDGSTTVRMRHVLPLSPGQPLLFLRVRVSLP